MINFLRLITAAFFVIIILSTESKAGGNQNIGEIKGRLTENNKGVNSPVPFATILIANTTIGVTSDIDGNYTLPVEPGTYDIVFSYIGFKSDTISGVIVDQGQIVNLDYTWDPQAIELIGVEVKARANRENQNALLMDRKEMTTLVQNLGAKEMSQKGVSNVADGLQKIAGLSIVGSNYVFVRGMGDRYNAAYLNGMPIASPDPDRRVIPLDIFPTNIVRNISVVKSYSPEYYGDFSGGVIDIRTKEFLNDPSWTVKMGFGLNTQSTFKKFNSYQGGKTDLLGFDDGSRSLPEELENTRGYNSSYDAESSQLPLESNFNPKIKRAPLNTSIGVFGGDYADINDNIGIGFVLSLNTTNSYDYQEGNMSLINLQNDYKLRYNFDSYTYNTSTSGLASIHLDLYRNHEITYNLLAVNRSSDNFQDAYGDHFDYATKVFSRRMTYRENRLITHQLQGSHGFMKNKRFQLDWALSTNAASNKEPDRKQLVYLYDDGLSSTGYQINAIDRLDNHRYFQNLQESETSMSLKARYHLLIDKDDPNMSVWSLTLGAQQTQKSRDFNYRIFVYDVKELSDFYPEGVDIDQPDQYFTPENHENGAFFIQDVTLPEAYHQGYLGVQAGFLSSDLKIPGTPVRVITGARYEISEQEILYRKQTDTWNSPRRRSFIEGGYLLPSLTTMVEINEKNILRVSASQTISRPGFREMAPFEYTEVFAGTKNVGNPDLQNGTNYNADIRYEIYPRLGEIISITGFYKQLLNPIEKTNLATASGQLQSFQNADQATVAGIELEITKKLTFLTADTNWTDKLTVGLNGTLLHSQVNFNTNSDISLIQTNTERALQGASPFLVNVDLSYQDYLIKDVKSTITLSYNVFGKRVFAAGVQGLGDQFELPVNTLNLVLRNNISDKFGVNCSFMNLLNPSSQIVQETNSDPVVINSFKRGRRINLGLSYTF